MASNNKPLALVTGASSGIGLEIARELGERGYDLLVVAETADIRRVSLGDAVEVIPLQLDLATPEGVEQLASRVMGLGRQLDVLVVNAGVGVGGAFIEQPLAKVLNLVDLNVRSTVHLAHLLLPGLVRQGQGRVLFTASVASVMPGPYEAAYAASKAFILSFAEALRHELLDSGVTVTALMPGPTETNFFHRAGMDDTQVGRAEKDDPAVVAREGVEAMLAGKDHVVAGSWSNQAQVTISGLMPETAKAKLHADKAKPIVD